MVTIEDLRHQGAILFECITGSKAYGLDLPHSDIDIRGVFILPERRFFGLDYLDQVSDETNDIIFYELRRFVDLLYQSNPNLLEMLNVAPEHILFKHPLFDRLRPEYFLSKRCKDTFLGYARTQIRKARGLNKKIFNPIPRERQSLLHFCYVAQNGGSVALLPWLAQRGWSQECCGLVNIPHMKDVYGLYYDQERKKGYRGILTKEDANDVTLSSIAKGEKLVAYLFFNRDGYSSYCKDYRQYWEWVEQRSEERYRNTLEHGKNYDAKNMMHTFRLLDMAEEILGKGKVIVRRPNRAELLRIRNGEYTFDELMTMADAKIRHIEELAETSPLPEEPDRGAIEEALVGIRKEWYG